MCRCMGTSGAQLGPKPAAGPYRNFRLTRDDDGIAWLLFDREGASANTLSEDVLVEFETVIAALEQDHEFLTKGDVFTQDLIDTWLWWKRNHEIDALRLRPHPFEFDLYYNA